MNTSPSPTAIAWAAELIAWSPEPHSRLTVRPPTSTGQPGEQHRHPGDVAVVLARLVRAAEDDVLDERRVDAGAVDDRAQDERGEVVGADARQRAAVAADGRPHRLDDPGLAERPVRISVIAADRSGSRSEATRHPWLTASQGTDPGGQPQVAAR